MIFGGRNKNCEKELQRRVFDEAQYRLSDITKNLEKLDNLLNDCVDMVNKLNV